MSSMHSNYEVFVPLRLPASVSSIAQSETWAVSGRSDEYRWEDPKWRSYRYIFLQTRTHSTMINQHNSVSHTFSVPNLSEMCRLVDELTGLLLSPTRYISINMRGMANIRWWYYIYIYITLSIIDIDFLYQWATLKIMQPQFLLSDILWKYVNISIIDW